MVKTLRSSSGHREIEKIKAGVSDSCPFWLISLNWRHLECLYFSLQSVVPSVFRLCLLCILFMAFVLKLDPYVASLMFSHLNVVSLEKSLFYFQLKSFLLNDYPWKHKPENLVIQSPAYVYLAKLEVEKEPWGGEASDFRGYVKSRTKVEKMCLETKPLVGAGGLSTIALCLFLSTQSPSRLENTHCSPRHLMLLTGNLLIHLRNYTFDLCRLSGSLSRNNSNDRHASRHWLSADAVTLVLLRRLPSQVSCDWKSAVWLVERNQEQKVAIFCFEAAFERSARISNGATQRCVL